ncbi:MAG: formimidoylglutamate deiminase, partial [Proteobacteria bacterium]|nr:formimidoylglutamate deiminase [Pseudomonadota bacterium]
MAESELLAQHLWTPQGWCDDARLRLAKGRVATIESHASTATEMRYRFVLPGMPNLHSHAFQRAMAGLAERRGQNADSFWTWREAMYGFASRVGPDDLRAIAAQLYVEMLK